MIRFFISISLACTLLNAAPAFQGTRTFMQDDGSSFQAHLGGDEYLNWIETQDGEILVYNKKNQTYDYAIIENGELKSSGEKYSKPNETNLRKARSLRSITTEELYRLWQTKRQKGLSR